MITSSPARPPTAPANSQWTRRLRLVWLAALTPILAASLVMVQPNPPTIDALAGEPSAEMAVTVAGVPVRDGSVINEGTTVNVGISGLLKPGIGTRELRASLDPGMQYTAGGAEAPEGWTIEYSVNDATSWSTTEPSPANTVTDVRAVAPVTAGAITGYSQLYSSRTVAPIPSSTFSGSTGGDGWDTFFSDDFVFNIFHHSDNTVLDCHLRSTGARCSGYTATFAGYRAGMRSGGWVDSTTGKLYAFTSPTSGASMNTAGVLCIDITATPVSCGYTPLTTDTAINYYGQLSEADFIGRRLFGIETAGTDSLLCFDAALNAVCPGSPIALTTSTGATGDNGQSRPLRLGNRIIAKTSTRIYCFDALTLTACSGTWPATINSATATPIAAHTTSSGVIDGVCYQNGCLDLTGATTAWTTPFSLGVGNPWMHAVVGAQTQSRYFYSSGQRVVDCFDYATNARCTNFPITYASNFNGVYTVRVDPDNPSCMWINSDGGLIRVFDAFSAAAACTANPVITLQPSSFAPRFTCTTNNSIDEWRELELVSFAGTGTPTTVVLTVRNALGDVVTGWENRAVTPGTPLDMTGLDVTLSGSRPTFSFAFAGVTGGSITSATIDLDYAGKGPELCVRTLLASNLDCPVLVGLDGSLIDSVGTPATYTIDRSFTIGTDTTNCPQNIVPQTVPSPPRTLTGTALNTTGRLTFVLPLDDGGAELREYKLSLDNGVSYTTPTVVDNGNGTRGIVLTGLTPGTTYPVQLRATNVIGRSDPATLSLYVTPLTVQTLSLAAAVDTPLNLGPITLPATSSEGLPVSYTAGPSGVCAVAGQVVTLLGEGSCTVNATQAGDATRAPATNSATFTVQPILQLSQTIAVTAPSDTRLGSGTVTVSGTTSSSLALTYTVSPAGVCTISGTTIALVGEGTCTVTASQAGDTFWLPATQDTTFVVLPRLQQPQIVTIPGIGDIPVDEGPITLPLTTTDGLPLTYTAGPAGVCTVAGNIVTLVGQGVCTLTADQAGDLTHEPGSTTVTFVVKPPKLALTLNLDGGQAVGSAPVVVRGANLKPFSLVRVELHSDPVLLGTVMTDADGSFVTTVHMPAVVPPGSHEVVAIGTRPDNAPISVRKALFVDWAGSFGERAPRGGFTPIVPIRVLDTRIVADGAGGDPLTGGDTHRLMIPAGLLPSDVTAVAINLTITDPARDGYATVHPCNSPLPLASSINFEAGQKVSNLVETIHESGEPICIFSTSTAHLVVDLSGYHAQTSTGRLLPLDQVRLADTRDSSMLGEGQTLEVTVIGDGRAPVGSSAVALTVTAVEPSAAGFLTVYPCGTERPWASNVNYRAGDIISNAVLAKVGADGKVCVFAMSPTHVVVDLDSAVHTSGVDWMTALVPGRLADSRLTAKLRGGHTTAWLVVGSAGAPAGTAAMVLNVTVTDPSSDGFLTVYPCGTTPPWVSNLNFAAGQTLSNHVTAEPGAAGTICIYSSVDTHVVIDVEGTYGHA